ncbi:hypothetical protein OA501_02320 [Flavobacteriaceae bacterium]|nr:hypothetical protein [Flavobacteriaceae bacterium]
MKNSNFTILGTWQNQDPYNSTLMIDKYDPNTGLITGVYKSSTGSSGTYSFSGFIRGNDGKNNESLCLAIDWKSIDGGEGDASWHWNSIYGGFYAVDASSDEDIPAERLEVLNNLTASLKYEGLVENPGTYSETLIFKKISKQTLPSIIKDTNSYKEGNPFVGTWKNIDDSALVQQIIYTSQKKPDVGSFSGKVVWIDNSTTLLTGYTDFDPFSAEGLKLQAISLVVQPREGDEFIIGFSGNYDFGDLSRSVQLNTSTCYAPSWKAKYFGIAMSSNIFERVT